MSEQNGIEGVHSESIRDVRRTRRFRDWCFVPEISREIGEIGVLIESRYLPNARTIFNIISLHVHTACS